MTTDDRHSVWLVVATEDGEHDVALQVTGRPSAGAVVDALCGHLGLDPDAASHLLVERLGATVSGGDALPSLRHGDRIRLIPSDGGTAAPPARAAGVMELVVRGGPLNGTRIPLPKGDSVVGRGSGSDVTLADPAMSRAHLRVTVDGERVTVADAGSTNGTFLAGRALTTSRVLARGDVVEAGTSLLTFERAPETAVATDEPVHDATVPFNRPPRVRAVPPTMSHELDAPPVKPTRPRLPLAASLVPLLLGIVMVVLFPENKAMLLFFAFTPVMAVWSLIEDRRTGRKGFAAESERFNERVAAMEERLEIVTTELAAQRRATFPAADELMNRAARVQEGLWERRATDEDFLQVRVGWGDEPSGLDIQIAQGGDEELRARADARLERFATLPSVPVAVDLRSAGVTGLAGVRDDVEGLARWVLAQIAVMTSPEDVTVAAVLSEDSRSSWSWLKWLPHVSLGDPQSDARLLAGSGVATRAVVEMLTAVVRERESAAAMHSGNHRPHFVLLIDENVAVPRADMTTLLRAGPRLGLSVVWMGSDRSRLPGEAGAIVEIDMGRDLLAVTYPDQGRTDERSGPETLSPELAHSIATALAPIRDVGSARSTARLPATVDLFEVVGVPPDAAALRARWSDAGGLEAAIGRTPAGVFRFDLRGDGPHCLIGGTTGSGKSELLQTAVGALAARYPPSRLNFILIDYKGGTAFKDCIRLPHVVGSVTDLDGSLAARALTSLDAEIKRRERMLRDAGARDLQEMERSGAPETPPSLALVVDEFATLVKELPEFVEGVVDVAQRGRALGIHLVLATQRPAGVISERIRANTNLRIALRVGDDNDSIDVIGAPDAARLERSLAGRGFARTGHAELVPFQAAFGGRPAPHAETGVLVTPLELEGAHATAVPGVADTERTQLQELVEAIVTAHGSDPAPFRPWLPPLATVVPVSRLLLDNTSSRPALGVIDEPSEQRQSIYRVDLDEVGSVLVYGTSGAGKTTFLRTLALSLASSARPDEAHIYGLDFSTHGLRVLEGLPHVGSVVTGDEEPRVRRLLTMIRAEIGSRRELLADAGASDLASYLRVSPVSVPRIVVLLDGYAGFASTFEKIDLGELVDLLPRLIADGRQLGIHFVLTAERRGVVPGSIAGLVGTRVVLPMADDDEYSAAGADPRATRGTKLLPGRAFVAGGLQMQVAIASDDGSGTDELTAFARAATELRERSSGTGAPPVRLLPETVEKALIPQAAGNLLAALGVDEDLAPVVADLGDAHFVVAGPYRSGRSTTLGAIADGIARSTDQVRLHLLAPRRSPLTSLTVWATTAEGTSACETAATSLLDEVTAEGHDGAPVVVVVDDLDELFDGGAAHALERIARAGRDGAVRILAAAENHALHRAFGGVAAELRKDKNGLLLDPDLDVDGDLLGVRLPRRKTQPFPPGRGYLVQRGSFRLIQVAI